MNRRLLTRGTHRSSLGKGRIGFPDEVFQVAPVVVGQFLGELLDLSGGDESHPEGDFLDAGDLQALSGLDGLDVVRGLDQRFDGTGIEPGESPAEDLDPELLPLEIDPIDVGDLQLTRGEGRSSAAISRTWLS